jgi:predicted ATPase
MSDLLQSPQNLITTLQALVGSPGEGDELRRSTAAMWLDRLQSAADNIAPDKPYPIIFFGKPGVGKSTLINVLLDLMVGDAPATSKSALKNQGMLSTGSGRTTVCEVNLGMSNDNTYRLEIVPLNLAETGQEIRLYAQSEWLRRTDPSALPDTDDTLAQEWGRFIRNMTGLVEYAETDPANPRKKRLVRPIENLAATKPTLEAFTAELVERAALDQRRTTSWVCNDLAEIKALFENINAGKQADALLPEKIALQLPARHFQALTQHGIDFPSVIDTRGLDGNISDRDDIHDHLDNPHATYVVCSAFNDAPDGDARKFFAAMNEDTLYQQALARTALVLIDREEASQVNGANGNREIGQMLKTDECIKVLAQNKFSIPQDDIFAIDVIQDDATRFDELVRRLALKIAGIKQGFQDAFESARTGAQNFIDIVKTEAEKSAILEINQKIKTVMTAAWPSGIPVQNPVEGIFSTINNAHPASKVYATARRKGKYSNLDLYSAVRQYALKAIGNWATPFWKTISAELKLLFDQSTEPSIKEYIALLENKIRGALNQFGREHASAIADELKAALHDQEPAKELWRRCCDEWGKGVGFIGRVNSHIKNWTDTKTYFVQHRTIRLAALLPFGDEITVQAPNLDATLTVHNLRALRHVEFSPEPVSLLVGANGVGKSTLLSAYGFLSTAWERGPLEAINLTFGGIQNLLSWQASETSQVLFKVTINHISWHLELNPNNEGRGLYFGEALFVGTDRLYARETSGQFTFRNQAIEARQVLALRQLIDRGETDGNLHIIAEFIQKIAVFSDLDIHGVATQGSVMADNRQLERRGRNAIAMLRAWRLDNTEKDRYDFVLRGLNLAFPNTIEDFDFDIAGELVMARTWKPGIETPCLLRHEANGVIQMLILLCAVASGKPGGIIAIDEPENCLHPFAASVFLRLAKRRAEAHNFKLILATHSIVMLDDMSDQPDSVFTMKPAEPGGPVPTRLTELCNREWLAEFQLGDLYEQGDIGSNEDEPVRRT